MAIPSLWMRKLRPREVNASPKDTQREPGMAGSQRQACGAFRVLVHESKPLHRLPVPVLEKLTVLMGT